MKRNASLVAAWLCFVFFIQLNAQDAPLAELNCPGNGKSIFFHHYTGIPIVQTTEVYVGIDPVNHQQLWSMPRSATAVASQAIDNEQTQGDYADLYATPFVYLGGSVVQVRTGQVAVDGAAADIKRYFRHYLVPELDLLLVELGAGGMVKLFAIDPFTGQQKWAIDLREQSGLGQLMAANSDAAAGLLPPRLTAAGDLAYHNGKYLALINPATGQLKWNEKLDPAYLFTNDEGNRIVVAEARGGLGGAMTTPGEGAKFGKTVHLIDASTGQGVWKRSANLSGNVLFMLPCAGGFLVVHDEGMNIYDFNSTEADGRWRRDFSASGIKNVVEQSDGLMVYFRNKRMLVDVATGEEQWKRAENLEREPPAYLMAMRSRQTEVGGAQVYTQGANLYIDRHGIPEVFAYDAYLIDAARGKVVVASQAEPETRHVGGTPYHVRVIDPATGAVVIRTVTVRKGIDAIVATTNGYFIYNDRAFVLLDFQDGRLDLRAEQYYPDPAAAGRTLGNLAIASAYVGAQNRAARGATEAIVANDAAALERYQNRMATTDQIAGNSGFVRQQTGRLDEQFAYFFSRNDNRELVLFKIDRNTGQEVRQYPFDDKTPVYEVDNTHQRLYYLVDSRLKVFAL